MTVSDTMSASSQQGNSSYCSDIDNSTEPSDIEDIDHKTGRELKPNKLYVVGYMFTVVVHIPDPPFGYRYDTDEPEYQPGWENLTQLDYCLLPSPL